MRVRPSSVWLQVIAGEEEGDDDVGLSPREPQGGGEAGEDIDNDLNTMSKPEDEKAESESTRTPEWCCMCAGTLEAGDRYDGE